MGFPYEASRLRTRYLWRNDRAQNEFKQPLQLSAVGTVDFLVTKVILLERHWIRTRTLLNALYDNEDYAKRYTYLSVGEVVAIVFTGVCLAVMKGTVNRLVAQHIKKFHTCLQESFFLRDNLNCRICQSVIPCVTCFVTCQLSCGEGVFTPYTVPKGQP